MTNFEKIAWSPKALGNFLAGIRTPEGPWDAAFRERFCAACGREDCDTAEGGCPYERERSNPYWWLAQTVDSERREEARE